MKKKKQLYDSYDLIVITRGGGSFEDLFGFCDEDLIQCIHEFKAPVLSAIGHEKDTTLLDLVADIISPTPSFAAEFITSHNLNYVTNQKSIIHKIQQKLNDSIYENINILNRYKNVIINQKNILDQFVNNFYINIQDEINQNMLYLEKVKSKFKVDNDINIFDLSYNNIKTQTDFTDKVKNNEPFILCWKDTVIKINSYNLING